MSPVSLGFSGVGLGALYVLVRVLRGDAAKLLESNAADATGAVTMGALWFFAFFWNVVALPVGYLMTQSMLDGEASWWFAWVLIFPLLGIGMLLAAIKATFIYLGGLIRRALAGPDDTTHSQRRGS
jgi:uncharacterized membrane protein YhaH (DUF805 family)